MSGTTGSDDSFELDERDAVELEKTIREQARKIDQLKDELARKNKALEDVMAENRLLVDELGGTKQQPGSAGAASAWLERWRQTKGPKS